MGNLFDVLACSARIYHCPLKEPALRASDLESLHERSPTISVKAKARQITINPQLEFSSVPPTGVPAHIGMLAVRDGVPAPVNAPVALPGHF